MRLGEANHPTRSRAFRPADPDWAPGDVLQSLRQRLYDIDPKLEIWWVPRAKPHDTAQKGRWAVVYWMARASVWSVVFHWEDKDGRYRPVEIGVTEPILQFLMAHDTGDPVEHNRKVEEREQKEEAKRLEKQYDTWGDKHDAWMRFSGARKSFGSKAIPPKRTGKLGGAHMARRLGP